MKRSTLVIEIAGLLLLAALGIWLRWPGMFTEGFHNEDAAGITYNADLLRHGLIPMVDSHEHKAPASFFLAYFAWEVLGRSIASLQQVAAGWALLAALGMWLGARLLTGSSKAAFLAALLYTVCSPITDSIDINYVAWMITPYIWASVACIAALKSGRLRWWFASGFLIALAALMKHPAGLVFPLFLGLLLARSLPRPTGWAPGVERRRGLVALFGGLAAGFSVLGFYYLAVGEPGAFIRTFFFSEGGWKYAAQTEIDGGDKLVRLWDGVLGFIEYMALPSVLAVLGAVWTPRGERLTVRSVFLVGHFVCSFAGLAIGFRFFKGYYLQMLPVALWLAVLPWGPLLRWAGARRVVWWKTALAALLVVGPVVPAAWADLRELSQIRKIRQRPVDLDVQRIGRIIRTHTTEADTIWVWGRWGWPAYFHADRLAASVHYKVMGVLTTNLTNTWRRPTAQTRFIHGEAEQTLMQDLRRNRPTFIVVSHNEDYKDFKDFRKLLREEYRPAPGFTTRRFNLYLRKDHPWKEAPKPKRPTRPKLPVIKRPGPATVVSAPVSAPPSAPTSSPNSAP